MRAAQSPFTPLLASSAEAAVLAGPAIARRPALFPSGAALAYAFTRAALRWAVRHWLKGLSVEQAVPLPPGPKIFTLNHPNMTDALLMPLIVPDQLCGLVQADLFDLPVVGALLKLLGQLPVTRHDGEQLLTAASAKLAAGWSVALCPEGKLNHGGPLFRGRTGAVRLALRTRAPLVPLGLYVAPHDLIDMHGTRHGRPCQGRVQAGGVCYVNLGRPWWPAPVPPGSETGVYLRQATDDLMARIETLTQQAAARCGV